MVQTGAERTAAHAARQRARGYRAVTVWVHQGQEPALRAYAARLRRFRGVAEAPSAPRKAPVVRQVEDRRDVAPARPPAPPPAPVLPPAPPQPPRKEHVRRAIGLLQGYEGQLRRQGKQAGRDAIAERVRLDLRQAGIGEAALAVALKKLAWNC